MTFWSPTVFFRGRELVKEVTNRHSMRYLLRVNVYESHTFIESGVEKLKTTGKYVLPGVFGSDWPQNASATKAETARANVSEQQRQMPFFCTA